MSNTPTIQQQSIPRELFGPLLEYSGDPADGARMQQQLETQGYVLLRGVLNRHQVLTARGEVFARLEEIGEIRSPAIDGIATGESRRDELIEDRKTFWRSVSEGQALRKVTHGRRLRELVDTALGVPTRAHDLLYLRPTPVGRWTRLHYDYPFFAGRSSRIHTVWIPFGDIPLSDGPLVIVEGSNTFSDLIDPIRNHDYQFERSNETVQKAAYERTNETDPVTFVHQRGTRLLSADFLAGDLVIFHGFTLHGSLDNCSLIGRVRLSCDVRYQPAADPHDDPRYFGANPTGSKGGGYGDMKAARPLSES